MLTDDVEGHDDSLAHERGAPAPNERTNLVVARNVVGVLEKRKFKI